MYIIENKILTMAFCDFCLFNYPAGINYINLK
jgi:hypothetical protein